MPIFQERSALHVVFAQQKGYFPILSLARTDKLLSPANEWSGALPYGGENLHCARTVQCVRATVSIRPLLYNKRVSAKESSTLVAPQI